MGLGGRHSSEREDWREEARNRPTVADVKGGRNQFLIPSFLRPELKACQCPPHRGW